MIACSFFRDVRVRLKTVQLAVGHCICTCCFSFSLCFTGRQAFPKDNNVTPKKPVSLLFGHIEKAKLLKRESIKKKKKTKTQAGRIDPFRSGC